LACPFYMTMVKDGINATGREEGLRVADVAELIAESISTRSESLGTDPR